MSKRKTKQDFINDALVVHGAKYIYSEVEYQNTHTAVKIICPIHGEFFQEPVCHLSQKQGCPECGGTKKGSTENFVSKARTIHGNLYDYSLVEYGNNDTKVKIICSLHGMFEQRPRNHIVGKAGCPRCSKTKRLTSDEFIQRSKEIHGEKYDYSLVQYINSTTKVKIICPTHGIWEVQPKAHTLSKNGCPKCSSSRGEEEIERFLISHNVPYISQFAPSGLHYVPSKKSHLRFDFFLPKHNLLIEFDGEQHKKFIKRYHRTIKGFKIQQERDKLKTNHAITNNIQLVRIPYSQIDNIPSILKHYLST